MEKVELEQQRKDIVSLRVDINQTIHQIEKIRDLSVENYRMALGPFKNQFESLSTIDQQNMNPIAFQSLQNYRDIQQITEILHQLNSSLMDVGQHLGHPIEDVPKLDNNPAPPTVV